MLNPFKQYTIKDLTFSYSRMNMRSQTNICILDDLEPPYKSELISSGFCIQHVADIKHITEVRNYPVVICDIDGVGTEIDSKQQGLGIALQISKAYPQIALGIYSGHTHGLVHRPDTALLINKDDDKESWSDKLDELIARTKDPRQVWSKIAVRLFNEGIPAKDIAKVESNYVKCYIKKRPMDRLCDHIELTKEALEAINSILSVLTNVTTIIATA